MMNDGCTSIDAERRFAANGNLTCAGDVVVGTGVGVASLASADQCECIRIM